MADFILTCKYEAIPKDAVSQTSECEYPRCHKPATAQVLWRSLSPANVLSRWIKSDCYCGPHAAEYAPMGSISQVMKKKVVVRIELPL